MRRSVGRYVLLASYLSVFFWFHFITCMCVAVSIVSGGAFYFFRSACSEVTIILFLAVLNSGLLYLCLRTHHVWDWLGLIFFLFPFLLIMTECFLLNKIAEAFDKLLRRIAGMSVHEAFKIVFLAVCFLSFF